MRRHAQPPRGRDHSELWGAIWVRGWSQRWASWRWDTRGLSPASLRPWWWPPSVTRVTSVVDNPRVLSRLGLPWDSAVRASIVVRRHPFEGTHQNRLRTLSAGFFRGSRRWPGKHV